MARTKRNPGDPVEIKFTIDGTTHTVSQVLPEIPEFSDVPSALAYVNNDEKQLVKAIVRGLKALLIGDVKKTAKKAFLAQNDPYRAEVRKQASILFAAWAAKVSSGQASTRKDARKILGEERVEKAWSKCIEKARVMLQTANEIEE